MTKIVLILIAAIAPLSWGTTFFVTTEYMPADAAYWIGFWRALPIGAVWLLYIRHWPRREWWLKLLVVSACNVGLFFPALFLSAYLLPGGLGTMLVAFQPILLALLVWLWLKRRPSFKTCIAICIGVCGIVLVLAAPYTDVSVYGICTSFVALLLFTIGTVLLEKWGVMDDDLSAYTAWQLFLGGLMILPMAFVMEGSCPDFFIERSGVAYAPLYGIVFMGLINTGLAYFIWFWALERLSLITVSMLGLLGPICAYFLDVCMLGKSLSQMELIGIALVLFGVAYQGAVGSRKRELCDATVADSLQGSSESA